MWTKLIYLPATVTWYEYLKTKPEYVGWLWPSTPMELKNFGASVGFDKAMKLATYTPFNILAIIIDEEI